MRLTKDEWGRTAEHAAAARYGEKHMGFYVFRRFYALPLGLAVAAGTIGWGGYWLWNRAAELFSGGVSVHGTTALWVVAVLLLAGSIALLRPSFIPRTPSATLLRAGLVLLAWLGFLGYLIGSIL